MNIKRRNWIISVILLVVAIAYTVLVKTVDVKAIGPQESSVGFATLNKGVSDAIGVNMNWYNITKYLGYIAFLFVAFYGIIGVIQLFKEKNILKVDKRIIIIGAFYVAVILVYIFFEKFIINYRPTLIDGELEASYPSSHTVLALCICGSSLLVSKYYIKNEKVRKVVNALTWILMIAILIGRIISGVHWCTDILGGVIISAFLLMSLYTCIDGVKKEN